MPPRVVHYFGHLQRRPGWVACDPRRTPANTELWRQVTCVACRLDLLWLRVSPTGTGGPVHIIVGLSSTGVAMRAATGPLVKLSWAELDSWFLAG